MAEHTPTPWHAGSTEHTELVMGFKDNSECVLAELDTDDVPMEETAANAAFIVKAVNNHDRLVKAVQDLLYGMQRVSERPDSLVALSIWSKADGEANAILTDLISPPRHA